MTQDEKICELEKQCTAFQERIKMVENTLYWIIRFIALQLGGLFVLWAAGVLKLK